jgi:GNAT superfamily N-acetyltransferase
VPDAANRAVRTATAADVPELTRLRGLMLVSVGVDLAADDGWRARCDQRFTELLAAPGFAVFVVDAPGGGLAACGAGWVDRRLPAPGGDGLAGYLANMSTDPAHRGQGLGRRVLGELMAWFTREGVTRVELNATEQAGSMYADVGFSPPQWPALRWHAPPQ